MLIFSKHFQNPKYFRRKSIGHKNVTNTKHTNTRTLRTNFIYDEIYNSDAIQIHNTCYGRFKFFFKIFMEFSKLVGPPPLFWKVIKNDSLF